MTLYLNAIRSSSDEVTSHFCILLLLVLDGTFKCIEPILFHFILFLLTLTRALYSIMQQIFLRA